MKRLAIGLIALCAVATLALSHTPKRVRAGETPASQAQATMAGTTDHRRPPARASAIPPSIISTDADTTGLLRESLTIAELLDEVNGDSGDGFTPVDRERFAAELKSDPELRDVVSN